MNHPISQVSHTNFRQHITMLYHEAATDGRSFLESGHEIAELTQQNVDQVARMLIAVFGVNTELTAQLYQALMNEKVQEIIFDAIGDVMKDVAGEDEKKENSEKYKQILSDVNNHGDDIGNTQTGRKTLRLEYGTAELLNGKRYRTMLKDIYRGGDKRHDVIRYSHEHKQRSERIIKSLHMMTILDREILLRKEYVNERTNVGKEGLLDYRLEHAPDSLSKEKSKLEMVKEFQDYTINDIKNMIDKKDRESFIRSNHKGYQIPRFYKENFNLPFSYSDLPPIIDFIIDATVIKYKL